MSEDELFGPEFLIRRPLLEAIDADEPVVLLIDEVDRADEEFEAFLLEVLSDFQITIPELGTIARDAGARRRADLEPHPRAPRRAQAADALPLDRASLARAGGRDRAAPRAGRLPSGWPRRRRRSCAGSAGSTWRSRRELPRRSTGRTRSPRSAARRSMPRSSSRRSARCSSSGRTSRPCATRRSPGSSKRPAPRRSASGVHGARDRPARGHLRPRAPRGRDRGRARAGRGRAPRPRRRRPHAAGGRLLRAPPDTRLAPRRPGALRPGVRCLVPARAVAPGSSAETGALQADRLVAASARERSRHRRGRSGEPSPASSARRCRSCCARRTSPR